MRNLDMKHYRVPEGVHVTKASTILIIFLLLALFAWMTERDSHAFNNVQYIKIDS